MNWFRKKSIVQDDAAVVAPRAQFYTVEKIGPNQELTPEGFLLCLNVKVGRTGQQLYGPGETPLEVGPDGVLIVHREPEEVFNPKFLASLNSKPISDDHPSGNVNPENWKDLAVGVASNIRRGEGVDEGYVLADLLICDKKAIEQVRDGKREVSIGYEADYELLKPGHARQYGLIGNHIALVEAGRCGPRCAITDHKHLTGDCNMGTKAGKKSVMDRIRAAFKSKDEAALEEALEDAEMQTMDPAAAAATGSDEVHIHLDSETIEPAPQMDEVINGRFQSIEDSIAALNQRFDEAFPVKGAGAAEHDAEVDPDMLDEVPAELKDEAATELPKGTADSAKYFRRAFQDTVALAEIVMPGITIPTHDSKADGKKVYDSICRLRRSALDLAYHQPDGRGVIDQLNGGQSLALSEMRCRDVKTLFNSVAAVRRVKNNDRNTVSPFQHRRDAPAPGAIRSLRDINEANRKHYMASK